jgi:hypothetical protein
MPERDVFSPAGQSIPKRNFRERRALNRISRLGLLLPTDQFKGENKKQTVEVDGRRTVYSTVLSLTIALPYEGDSVVRRTDIEIERNPNNLHRITALTADSRIDDDTADYYGIQAKHEQFSLANYENGLSIHRVADEMSLAVRAVRRYQANAQAATPAYP